MKIGFRTALLLAASAAVIAPTQAATNILVNGSFENGLTGWTVSSSGTTNAAPVVGTYNSSAAYPDSAFGEAVPVDTITSNPSSDTAGAKYLYFSTDTGTNTLGQTVSLVAGHNYSFGFDYYLPGNGYGNPNNFTLQWLFNGMAVGSVSAGPGTAAQTWYTMTTGQTVGADMTGTLALAFTGSGSTAKDVVVDRVYLIDNTAAVPEPATWAMMISGFGLIGALMRRKRAVGSPA